MADDLLPEWDQVDWMTDPALAYGKGLADGYQLGIEAYDRILADGMAEMLSGSATTVRHEAIKVHERLVAARRRRVEADDARPRDGDFPGTSEQVAA